MEKIEFREIKAGESFDPLTICRESPFTQAEFYGDWQNSLGREVKRFVSTDNHGTIAYFQVIKYPLLLNKNYFYIPYGPVIKNVSEEFLRALKTELFNFAQKNNGVFVRLDFTPIISDSVSQKLLTNLFTKAPSHTYHSAYFQPRFEWFLNLDKTEDQIFDGMHKNTRYSIRFAGKNGIQTEIISTDFEKYFSIFYELMKNTSKRNSFSLHPEEYYKNIFKNLNSDNAYLSIAKFGNKVLTVNLVILYGQVANHVFGGSGDEHRNLMPSYLAQWAAICHAKKIGKSSYNFGGISSLGTHKNWEGLTSFKKKFGGYEVVHSDFFDIVVQPFWYHLYNFRKIIKSYL